MKQSSKKLLSIAAVGLLSIPIIATPAIISSNISKNNTYNTTSTICRTLDKEIENVNEEYTVLEFSKPVINNLSILVMVSSFAAFSLMVLACIIVFRKYKKIDAEYKLVKNS